jgi:LuxR family maltose regulon positive regulatory protein
MFLIPLDHQNRWFRYHYLFQKLLFNQLRRQYSAEQIEALHAQASGWFASKGLIEEALHHAQASGDMEKASELVARFGHQLMNDQQWSRLESCLRQLPRDLVERDPAMLILKAWLQHIRQNMSGMATCLEKIEILYDTSPPNTLNNLKHVQGHIEVLRGMKYYMAADGENALAQLRCAREIVSLRHIRARLFADIFQLGAYQMVGDLQTGLQIYQQAMRDISEEKKYNSAYLANLCFIYWMDADLAVLRKTAESVLNVAKDNRLLETVGHALYFLGIVHYQRNEMHSAEEKLAEVINEHYATSPMNFARSSFALALTYHALRKPSKAREICNAVMADAIRKNDRDRLKDAQAFEAELALTQGRLAVASRWAREYQAKPFRPTYGFYLPQLTLIKILMVEETTDSRRRAADLLDQLLEFFTSIHNIRFQIDVLALRALLHHTRGEKSAALEKLTAALVLAEPGGFIRPFVDLGPQMADLLKRLVKQNVAVGYIEKLLAAFRDDEQVAVPEVLKPQAALTLAASPQPLEDPLTNRELEILQLLAQRLRNKEIAAKLFISTETVKKHLNNTYRKLNVSSRRQAVEKAHALEILSSG